MANRCKVCHHERRDEIEREILSTDASNRQIATRWKLSEAGIRRHKAHMSEDIRAFELVKAEVDGDLAAEIQQIKQETAQIKAAAMKTRDHRTALLAIDRQQALIKTLGDLLLRQRELDREKDDGRIVVEYRLVGDG